jgi:gluconokinase
MGNVYVIMGVCGCGKTTVGEGLAEATDGVFIEGDSYHSSENVEKMRSGTPLDDTDRQCWLESLAEVIREHAEKPGSCFVGCSALKASYREILRQGDPHLGVIYLHGEESVLNERMQGRKGHFMPAGLLDSQRAILEEPLEAIRVSIDQAPEGIVQEVLKQLTLR